MTTNAINMSNHHLISWTNCESFNELLSRFLNIDWNLKENMEKARLVIEEKETLIQISPTTKNTSLTIEPT